MVADADELPQYAAAFRGEALSARNEERWRALRRRQAEALLATHERTSTAAQDEERIDMNPNPHPHPIPIPGPTPAPSELLMVTADVLAGHSGGPAVVRQNDQLVVIGWNILSFCGRSWSSSDITHQEVEIGMSRLSGKSCLLNKCNLGTSKFNCLVHAGCDRSEPRPVNEMCGGLHGCAAHQSSERSANQWQCRCMHDA